MPGLKGSTRCINDVLRGVKIWLAKFKVQYVAARSLKPLNAVKNPEHGLSHCIARCFRKMLHMLSSVAKFRI